MYTDEFPQQQNVLEKAGHLENKAAWHQEKRLMHDSCFSSEEVWAAGEFCVPAPAYSYGTTKSSLDWLAGEHQGLVLDASQAAVRGDTRRHERSKALPPLLGNPPQCLMSSSIQSEVLIEHSAEHGQSSREATRAEDAVLEEEMVVRVMQVASDGRGVSLDASESNIDDDRQEQSAPSLSSLMILSAKLGGESLSRRSDYLSDNTVDSSIVLDIEGEFLPLDNEISIPLSSTTTKISPPPPSQSQEENNHASHRMTDFADGIRMLNADIALQLPPIVSFPRAEKEASFSVTELGDLEEKQPLTASHAEKMGGRNGKTPMPSPLPSPLRPQEEKQFRSEHATAPVAHAVVASLQPLLAAERKLSSQQPRYFDHYVRQAQAKRTKRAEEKRQQRLKEAEERRHTPQLSLLAERRGLRSMGEYIEDSRVWEQRRADHVNSVAAQLEVAEEEERCAAVIANATSERIVKEMEERKTRAGVVEGAMQHPAARQFLLKRLQEKYTSSFKPITTPTAERQMTAESQAHQEGGNNLLVKELFSRFMCYREESEKRRERLLQREAEQQVAPPKKRRTMTHVKEYARSMWEQDEKRHDKLRRQAEREREEEEERMRAMQPQVIWRPSKLVERFRQRQRQRAAATTTSTPTSVPHVAAFRIGEVHQQPQRAASGKMGSPPPKRPTPPTSRKLAFSSSNSHSDHQKPVTLDPRETVTSVGSLDFEERNVWLLQMRQRRVESRRREVKKKLTETCTFKPQVNPVSRRMVASYYRHQWRPHAFQQTPLSRFGSKQWPSSAATTRTGTRKDVDGDFATARGTRVAKDVDERVENILLPPGVEDEDRGTNDDDEDNLAVHIEVLEALLAQWKQLEAEYRV
ncbi:hypothetical protein TraAM80_03978 [Trypanosoma rangeli]|uniref:Uncharacterized protein n=1 Tax=Trypanosoma rangeli TaxID=5698 RepID=A0A3R7MIJ2_TRYRA|nr:uncharacterized protein TraAM80_03978 [Trypanosoma rangeli]RNF06559.1 hypothetical protein TraAM80_03978 [Trypanosoma rangeli]|eukprot:RNF06559.1 hypothetical protein TraAM80_03978 [Trypanosoma rangeli]